MRFDADYLRTIPLWSKFPDRLVEEKQHLASPWTWFEAVNAAHHFVAAEHERVYKRSAVDWFAALKSEFEGLTDWRVHGSDRGRQFVAYLDLKHLLLIRLEHDRLAIDRIVSSRS